MKNKIRIYNFFSNAVLLTIILIALSVMFIFSISEIKYTVLETKELVLDLNIQLISLNEKSKEFINQDTESVTFYRASTSASIKSYESIYNKISNSIIKLKSNSVINSQDDIIKELGDIEKLIDNHNLKFKLLINAYLRRGNDYTGILGELKSAVSSVEYYLSFRQNYQLLSKVLEMRKVEKDYLLTRNHQYVIDHQNSIYKLKNDTLIKIQDAEMDLDVKELLLISLKDYEHSFEKLTKVDSEIGNYSEKGLLQEIKTIEDNLAEKINKVNLNLDREVDEHFKNSIYFAGSLIGGILLILILILRQNKVLKQKQLELSEEITYRKVVEEELSKLKSDLEDEVEKRTIALKASLEDLEKAQEELLDSERTIAMSKIMGQIAHHLNTPIGASITVLSYTKTKLLDTKVSFKSNTITKSMLVNFFDEIENNIKVMSQYLRRSADLIDLFNNMNLEDLNQMICLFNMKDSINEVVQNLNISRPDSERKIITNIKDITSLKANEKIIKLIIHQLVTNSLDHGIHNMADGRVEILAMKVDNILILRVSDNGIGIDEKKLPHIFDIFYTTSNNSFKSMGLGLNLVHKIVVEVLGGSISCKSTINEGTCMQIEIPLLYE